MRSFTLIPLAVMAAMALGCGEQPIPTAANQVPDVGRELVAAATFTVTNTNDSGAGSLGRAILDANANAGLDVIEFNIPASDPNCDVSGFCTISVPDPLIVEEPTIIDGFSQPGSFEPAGLLPVVIKIAIVADAGLLNFGGLTLCNHLGSTVQGLAIGGFGGPGVFLLQGGEHNVKNNIIGNSPDLDKPPWPLAADNGRGGDHPLKDVAPPDLPCEFLAGTPSLPTTVDYGGSGIVLFASDANLIEGNFLKENDANGILTHFSTGNVLRGNGVINHSASDPSDIEAGILLESSSDDNLVESNEISGNAGFGINLFQSSDNIVRDNVVNPGPTASGGIAVGEGMNTTIAGNTIDGTLNLDGIVAQFSDATTLTSNLVFQSDRDGVLLFQSSNGVVADNTITESSRDGLRIIQSSDDNTVADNIIADSGRLGIVVVLSSDNFIEGNVIAHNMIEGVLVAFGGRRNAIRSNSISDNGGLGIDLSGTFPPDGVTLNDIGDGDVGPNDRQNFPVLTKAKTQKVNGTLNSRPNTTLDIEFFSNDAADITGHGEGQTFLTSVSVTTDANGDVKFKTKISPRVLEGKFITATATDPDGNTSEFSEAVEVK